MSDIYDIASTFAMFGTGLALVAFSIYIIVMAIQEIRECG